MLTWRKKTMEFPTQIPLEPRRKNETTQNYVSRASLALKGILGELCSTNNGYSAMKSATEPFPSRPCLAPHPHSLCFLQGNSNILQWWKDSLIISHTQKKTVIVFRFTWKLMDLGIPDVDVQNPLWSLSGDLSSLGCLWRTPVSAEVICELFHTKSRFFWERQCTHTHTHMHTHSPPPPCPAPCQQVLPQSAATQGGTSCPTGFGGFREEKGGIQARPCGAHGLQSSTLCCLSPHPRLGQISGCCCSPCSAETELAGQTHGYFSLCAAILMCHGSPAQEPLCQPLGLHTELSAWARGRCLWEMEFLLAFNKL